ncbi:MAG: hypothetical protein WCT32_03360 [Patescibacteria group bacterium]
MAQDLLGMTSKPTLSDRLTTAGRIVRLRYWLSFKLWARNKIGAKTEHWIYTFRSSQSLHPPIRIKIRSARWMSPYQYRQIWQAAIEVGQLQWNVPTVMLDHTSRPCLPGTKCDKLLDLRKAEPTWH